MRRLIFLTATFIFIGTTLMAQNYIIVDSEKVFKAEKSYNDAITSLDAMAEQYQAEVDKRFESVEAAYNSYMQQRSVLSAEEREAREAAILEAEKQATEYQESIFGDEGTLMKKRIELIEPIQKEIFATIEAYAKSVGAELVLDSANNPSILYSNPTIDHTDRVIEKLK